MFNKNLGQNFLISKKKTQIILNLIKYKFLFIEIGAGLGFLNIKFKNSFLLELCKIYYNILKYNNYFSLNSDILYFNFYILKKNNIKYFIIGNLPYKICFLILLYLINFLKLFNKIFFMLPNFFFKRKNLIFKIFFIEKKKLLLFNYNFFPKPKIKSEFYKILKLKLFLLEIKDYNNFYILFKKTKIKININYYIKLFFKIKKKNIQFYNVL